jgi:hypothetical protein
MRHFRHPFQRSAECDDQVEATQPSGKVGGSNLGLKTPYYGDDQAVTEKAYIEDLGPFVRLAGNHATIEQFNLTTFSDVMMPSLIIDQQASKLVIPEHQMRQA